MSHIFKSGLPLLMACLLPSSACAIEKPVAGNQRAEVRRISNPTPVEQDIAKAPTDKKNLERSSSSKRDIANQERSLLAAEVSAASAKFANNLAMINIFLGIVGFIILILSLRQTREGISKAESANQLTERMMNYDLRPWLELEMEISSATWDVFVSPLGFNFTIVFSIKNSGRSSAQFVLKRRLIMPDGKADILRDNAENEPSFSQVWTDAIAPGQMLRSQPISFNRSTADLDIWQDHRTMILPEEIYYLEYIWSHGTGRVVQVRAIGEYNNRGEFCGFDVGINRKITGLTTIPARPQRVE